MMERGWKKAAHIRLGLLIVAFFLTPCGLCVATGSEKASPEKMVRFRWAFWAVAKRGEESRLVPVKSKAALHTGDRIKMFLEPVGDCHLYVLYQSSRGALSRLFPEGYRGILRKSEKQTRYYVPPGDAWFELDEQTGQETFFLLAAPDRLERLEKLMASYESAEKAKKDRLGKEILEEIESLRRKHRRLKSVAERPVAIIGRLRGGQEGAKSAGWELARTANEVSTDRFYHRIFRIDHR